MEFRNLQEKFENYSNSYYFFLTLGPPLVIAYALAGRVDIDFETEPLGHDADNKPVFLADIWPTRKEIQVCPIFNNGRNGS